MGGGVVDASVDGAQSGMITSLRPLQIRMALGRKTWGPPHPFGDGWYIDHLRQRSRIIVTPDLIDDVEWVHASISHHDHTPTYEDLKTLHAAVFGPDGWSYQVFAPASENVNIHQHALHLFGRADGLPALPDFTHGSGSI